MVMERLSKEMDLDTLLRQVHEKVAPSFGKGHVATYIPALAEVNPDKFGVAIQTIDGKEYAIGDAHEPFSIQSISKVFTLTLALRFEGDAIWRRVGREPSGNPFNSLVQLEVEHGKPRNPFINAGALVITDMLVTHLTDPKAEILDFVRRIAGSQTISYDLEVAASERKAGHRNFALAHFLKSFGNIHNDVETVLDVYFHQCSLRLTCAELARAALFLANSGRTPLSQTEITSPRQAKRLNALLLTCGTYDEGGDFAYKVGLPCKSGVGGGIVGVLPRDLCIAAWSPRLNARHNSVCGKKALEWFTTLTGCSIF